MKDLIIKDYLNIGFSLGIDSYFKIFFYNILYYIFCYLISLTFVGILIIPALTVSFYKFLLSEARNEDISFFELIKQGFKNGLYWKSWLYFLIICLIYLPAIIPLIFAAYIIVVYETIIFGFIFLILSLILYLYIKTKFYLGFIFLLDNDKNLNPIGSLIESSIVVDKLGFKRIFFINLISYLAYFFGFIVFLFPFFFMTHVGVYINAINKND